MTALALFVVILGLGAYVRLSPINEAQFHKDPATKTPPSASGHVLVAPNGDIDSPRFDMNADDLAAKLEAIILDTPRTTHLAGDLSETYASYVTRSALWGFPDIASVRIVADGPDASEVIIWSRLRFGAADMGVNAARVEGWLSQLASDD